MAKTKTYPDHPWGDLSNPSPHPPNGTQPPGGSTGSGKVAKGRDGTTDPYPPSQTIPAKAADRPRPGGSIPMGKQPRAR